MDTAQFLARVVPPGNYIAIGYVDQGKLNPKSGKPWFNHRFFPEGDHEGAAGFLQWASKRGFDAYHANASYLLAQQDGVDNRNQPKFRGERTQANVQRLRAFWIDLDLKRDGDKKAPGQCYADAREAFEWLGKFRADTGLPRPNLGVSSGYGLHVYWVLEDALTRDAWQPYADAFKAAMIASGFKGDPGISSDAARILRPPGTRNMKVPTAPADVLAIPKLAAGDVPNSLILGVLQHWVSTTVVVGSAGMTSTGVMQSGSSVSALAGGGNVSSIFAGTAAPNMNAAAANAPNTRRPRSLAKIAARCGQVAHSLATGGATDIYPFWYLGMLTLAHFCEDGAAHVHALSSGHPGYSPQATDAAVAQIAGEQARKANGAPSCKHFEDRGDPTICQACPFHGKIKGPWELGVDDNDLPDRYRRANGGLQHRVLDSKGEFQWVELLAGDCTAPLLDWLPAGGYALTFDYTRAGTTRVIYTVASEMGTEDSTLHKAFQVQGVHLMPGTEKRFRGFVMAWIDKLISARAVRTEAVHPWGWATNASGLSGFALAGTLYRTDGTQEPAPGGDLEMLAMFKPCGDLVRWQQAFDFVTQGRPDLQAIIAASFGAPLMRFTGHAGMIMSGWSRQSGVGKTSALTVAQGVWASAQAINSMDDTSNAVLNKVARTRAMVCLWDEARIMDAERGKQFTSMLFALVQGKEKARMRSDTSLRSVGHWETILVCTANKPLMDYVVAQDEGTEAGAVRLFEFPITIPSTSASASAQPIIGLAKSNHGHAGVAYAAWLAMNAGKAEKVVEMTAASLIRDLQAEQSERLYIAGMSTMLAGARIATGLGIAKFDVPALREFLCNTFIALRKARQRDVVVSSQGYDLEQVLSSFVAAHSASKLATNWFARQGGKAVTVRWIPQARMVDVHISIKDQAMRFDRKVFYRWARENGLSGPDLIDEMTTSWKAFTHRVTLGGGTGFANGQLWCVEVPLTAPEMAGYTQFAEDVPAGQPVKDRAKGNQPKA